MTVLDGALAWYRTPLARKLVRLESDAAKVQAEPSALADEMRAQPPSEARLSLVDRLDGASGLTEAKLDMAAAIVGVVQKIMLPFPPAERRPDPADIEAAMARMRTVQREVAKQTSRLTLLRAYRSVPDADLTQYVEFCETDACRSFLTALRMSILDAMMPAADKALREAMRLATSPDTGARPKH